MLNNNLVEIIKGIIVENTYELYAENDTELQKSLENTELEFDNMTEEECLDRYSNIVDEYCQMCDNCGEWHLIENLTSLQYQEVCEECLENEYCMCQCCEELVHNDETTMGYDVDKEHDAIICEGCQENGYNVEYCEYHERYEIAEDFYTVEDYGRVCQEGMDYGEFCVCDNCEYTYHIDCMHFEDYGCYCNDCYEECGCGIIGNYHSSDFEFKTLNNEEEKIGIGFELELEFDRYSNRMTLAERIDDEIIDVHLENDCSLCNGFEVISNPMTINYFNEEFATEIDNIVEICANNYNYNHNSAGFHVHMTKETPQQTQNLTLLVEYFKEELTTLSRRNGMELQKWAKFYTRGIEKAEFDNDLFDKLKEEISNFPSRYHALNTTNSHTNEIRIFRGGLDALEIKARIELCHNFNQYAKYNQINLDNMPSFIEVATFDMNNYVTDYLHAEFEGFCQEMGI